MNVASRRGTVGGFSGIVSLLKSLPCRLLILCPFCIYSPSPSPLPLCLFSLFSAPSQIPLQFTSSVSSSYSSSTAAATPSVLLFYWQCVRLQPEAKPGSVRAGAGAGAQEQRAWPQGRNELHLCGNPCIHNELPMRSRWRVCVCVSPDSYVCVCAQPICPLQFTATHFARACRANKLQMAGNKNCQGFVPQLTVRPTVCPPVCPSVRSSKFPQFALRFGLPISFNNPGFA